MIILSIEGFELHLDALPIFAADELALDWHTLFSIWFAGHVVSLTQYHQ